MILLYLPASLRLALKLGLITIFFNMVRERFIKATPITARIVYKPIKSRLKYGHILAPALLAYCLFAFFLLDPWGDIRIGADNQLRRFWSISAIIYHCGERKRTLGACYAHRFDIRSG